MGKFICQLNNPELYNELPEKKLLKKRKRTKQIYECLNERYLLTEKGMEINPEDLSQPE